MEDKDLSALTEAINRFVSDWVEQHPDVTKEAALAELSEAVKNKLLAGEFGNFDPDKMPSISAKGKKPTQALYPLDKLNAYLWTAQEDVGEAVALKVNAAKDPDAYIVYKLEQEYNDLMPPQAASKLNLQDKSVFVAYTALMLAGNEYISINQIWKVYHASDGAPEQLQEIENSIKKMTHTFISADNSKNIYGLQAERSLYKNYPDARLTLDNAQIIPAEIYTAVINGKLTKVVKPYRLPPVMEFAQQRKQITTIPVAALQSPKKSRKYVEMEDYLLQRINRKDGHTILLETIWAHCPSLNSSDKLERSRAKKTLAERMQHYKDSGMIADFKMFPDKVTFSRK